MFFHNIVCSFQGIPNEKDLFGSLWMETNEPVIKKKKRRSSLFMCTPQLADITELQFKHGDTVSVSSGNASTPAITSSNVHFPRLSLEDECSDTLKSESMSAIDKNQAVLQPSPMAKSDSRCCETTLSISSEVTPSDPVPSISTPSSMSPEYAESPEEYLHGNSHEESYLTYTMDNKENLEDAVCDIDQSFISISKKESVKLQSALPVGNNVNTTEPVSNVKLDSREIEEVKNSNTSPGILSISKAIGKVVDFVKTSPSYIFGNGNGTKTDQQTASPVLKLNTDKNVISLSTSGKSNEWSDEENHVADCISDKYQTVGTQPQEKMDIFQDTYNAIMKVFQRPPVDKDMCSKTMELNQETVTNCHVETHHTDSLMETAEPPTPNIETASEIVQNRSLVEGENTKSNSHIAVNEFESTSSMYDINQEIDSLTQTVTPSTTRDQNCKDNNMELINSTEKSEIASGQENDTKTDVSTDSQENSRPRGEGTNTDVDSLLYEGMEMKRYKTNTDVGKSMTVDVTKHADLHSGPASDINLLFIDKSMSKVISRTENILQKYKRRSKDHASLKSQLPLKNDEYTSYSKDDSEINNVSSESALHSQSNINTICQKYSRKGRRSADHNTLILDLHTTVHGIGCVKTTLTNVDNVELICSDSPANSKACSGFTEDSEMCAFQIETSLQSCDGEHKNAETAENEVYTNTNMVTDDSFVTKTELVKGRRSGRVRKPVLKTEVTGVGMREDREISNTKVFEDDLDKNDDFATVPLTKRRSRRSLDNNLLIATIKSFREDPDKDGFEDVGTNNSDESEVGRKKVLRKRRKSSEKPSLETVLEQELAEIADNAKTTKFSKKRKKDDDVDVEKIYKNKNFVKPEQHKPWQTIFESPDKSGETLGKKRMQRFINFAMPSQMKLRRRLQKATKNGWNPSLKKRTVLNDQEVQDKLTSLWLDLDSCDTETETLQDKLRAIVDIK